MALWVETVALRSARSLQLTSTSGSYLDRTCLLVRERGEWSAGRGSAALAGQGSRLAAADPGEHRCLGFRARQDAACSSRPASRGSCPPPLRGSSPRPHRVPAAVRATCGHRGQRASQHNKKPASGGVRPLLPQAPAVAGAAAEGWRDGERAEASPARCGRVEPHGAPLRRERKRLGKTLTTVLVTGIGSPASDAAVSVLEEEQAGQASGQGRGQGHSTAP